MKDFFVKILLFAVFASIFYVCILFFWGNYAPALFQPNLTDLKGGYGHSFSRLKEVKQVNKDIDILFLGSSHAYRGFDTRIFEKHGFNTFNLGTTSQTPMQTLLLTRRYLEQIQPKLVVYEVYPITFMIDGVEGALDVIANDCNDLHSLKMTVEINNVKTHNAFIYSATRDILHQNKTHKEPTYKENEVRGDDAYIKGGFVQKETGFIDMRKITPEHLQVAKQQLKAFKEIINELDKREIDLILVYAPISKAMLANFSNKHYYDSLMTTYGEYYNFNEMMELNDTIHFYDRHHLNQVGVELFNEKLIETIQKNKNR